MKFRRIINIVIEILTLGILLSCNTSKEKTMTDHQKAYEIKEKIDRGNLMIGILDAEQVDIMIDLFTKSGNSGNPDSWYELGMIYYLGIGVAQDAEKALTYFENAAQNGYGLDAWIKYMRIAYFADLTSVEPDKIVDLVEELQEKDTSGEVYLLKGYMLYRGYAFDENWEYSFMAHQQSANKGNADAMFELCIYYTHGIGTEEDIEKALQWCTKAAENDNTRAIYNLGAYYATGYESIPQDINMAVQYYTKAANSGHGKAAGQLAVMYTTGDEIQKNEEKAKKFYELALENDYDVDILFEDLGLEPID